MRTRMWIVLIAGCLLTGSIAYPSAPAQRLPSALLIFPLVVADGTTDTRIEVVNLSSRPVKASCFYVDGNSCNELGFFVSFTPHQPLSWLASRGLFNGRSAVPPFFGTGEMKCLVVADREDLDAHNTIQGRAVVFDSSGDQTAGYGAIGIRRLTPGPTPSVVRMDGVEYDRCPDEQHFAFLAAEDSDPPDARSEVVFAPCSEDLANQVFGSTTIQFRIVNEFEQVLSAATSVTCHARRVLADIHPAFSRAFLGSPTGHLTVRAVDSPVITLLIDRFPVGSGVASAANEPILEGGRSATITFP